LRSTIQRIRREWRALLSIAVIVPVGFYGKAYKGPAAHWVNDSLGGAFYVIFWCLVVTVLWPHARASRVAAAVLAATCTLEFLQRWHPPFLEYLRSFFIGRTILGSYFDWYDFPYYFAGALLAWFWLRALGRR
jgi:hypothetical protein